LSWAVASGCRVAIKSTGPLDFAMTFFPIVHRVS
jgi:hypothetical protein